MTIQSPYNTLSQAPSYITSSKAVLLFIALCLLPPIATVFESTMIAHMLIQLPLLGLCGGLLLVENSALYRAANKYDPKGAIALVIGSGWLLFWMLPMNLDFASTDTGYRILKLLTVPLGVGLCLRWAWNRSGMIVRIVVLFEAWAVIARMGLLYLQSPEQLCSNYLIGEQQIVGKILLTVAMITGFVGLIFGVFGKFYPFKKTDNW